MNRAKRLETQRYRRIVALRDGYCRICTANQSVNGKSLCSQCALDNNLRKKERLRQMKLAVINHYGGECKCCHLTNLIFLVIDHIKGGGNQHRKTLIRGSGEFYKWIINNNFPPDFQVLCWNCNAAKYFNNGICPHFGLHL
jgi:hypothetical protein